MANLFDKRDKVRSTAKSQAHYDLLHQYMDQVAMSMRDTMGDPLARETAMVTLRDQVRMEFRAKGLAADHYRNLERRIAEPLAEARIALVRTEFPTLPQGFITRLGQLLADWVFEDHELAEFSVALDGAGIPDNVRADLVPKLEAWVEEDRPLIVES